MTKRKLGFVLLMAMVILWLGNPPERQYLESVANDFGKTHHGMTLNAKQLATMGESTYHEFLIASSYEYAFGNIQVAYFRIAFTTFYLGSSRKSTASPKPLKST